MAIGRRVLLAVACASCIYGADPEERADYVIYYSGGSTVLDQAAEATVTRAAKAAAGKRSDVVVAGYADAAGMPEANQIQSRIRAQLVANALLQAGVPRERITLTPRRALGGDPGVESRRVDIRLGA